MMCKVVPSIGTLPRLGPLLPKGILAHLNNYLLHKQLTIMARAGAWGGSHRQDRERVREEPTESSCDLVFGDTKEVGCSCVPRYAFWWVINLRGSRMGIN